MTIEVKITKKDGKAVSLENIDGERITVSYEILNKAIKLGRVKLVKSFEHELENSAVTIEDRARALGFKQMDGYLYQISSDKLYIVIERKTSEVSFSDCEDIKRFKGSLIVSGGAGIESCYAMFHGCNARRIDLRKLEAKNIKNVTRMFHYCKLLKKLNIGSLDTSKVHLMTWMFEGCESLKELDIGSLDTSEVYDMSFMFNDCKSLEKLDLSGFNTSKVQDMSYMFNSCKSLKELNISSFNPVKRAEIQSMFSGCEKLEKMDMSNFDRLDMLTVENIGIYDIYDMVPVEKLREIFSGCTSLKEIYVKNNDVKQAMDEYDKHFGDIACIKG